MSQKAMNIILVRLLLNAAVTLLVISAYSQDSINTRIIGLSPTVFKKVLNQQFSNLVTGQSKNSIGNFAALDLKENKVSFAGSSIFNSGSVLSVTASGAVSDGLYSIFSNSKINTQVSLDLQYNFLALSKKKLQYDYDTLRQYQSKIDEIEYDYKLKKLSINSRHDSLLLEANKRKANNHIHIIDSLLEISNQSQSRLDSLQFEKARTKILLDSIETAILTLPNLGTQIRILRNWRIQQKGNVSFESAVYGFSIGWFSIGYKVTNNSFKLFDSSATFNHQVLDTNFVSHEVSVQYSKYKWTETQYETYFWDLGVAFKYADNFNTLSKKEITETTNYGVNIGDRSITNKYNAYQGTYATNLKQLRFYGDFYYFLFSNNIAAFHVYPEWVVQKNEKPIADFGTGLLIALKDSKTEGSIINAEIYYNFLDIFKTTEKTYKFFERNNVGIRFAFPLKFK